MDLGGTYVWRKRLYQSKLPNIIKRHQSVISMRLANFGEAAKHYEAGKHEKAAHHAHTARAHAVHAREHSEEAAKVHLEAHGKK